MAQTRNNIQARYRERNRDKIRIKGRKAAERKRRAAGQAIRGSDEWKAKLRALPGSRPSGNEHPNWKGDDAGYGALHDWVTRWRPKTGACSDCGSAGRTQWHNLSGEYRRELDDWIEVCARCHKRRHGFGLVHGTETGYGYYRCRCEECRRAHRDRARNYLRRKRERVS